MFFERVYNVVKDIPKGKVATYGQIATILGMPKYAKYVGYALHQNPGPGIIPCHRVVNRLGALSPAFAFGGKNKQKELLEAEGVVVDENGVVDLKKYQWKPELSGIFSDNI